MAVEKTLRLESTERFPLSHRHDDEDCRKFHQGLLRKKETKEQSNGVPENLNAQTRPW